MIISIITINLNNSSGLQKSIESVINQCNSNFEFIIIDGGSSDKSVEIIKKNSRNISYWVSEPDNGIYNAMNKAIRVAKGEYCLFLNSGDVLYNDQVLNQIIQTELYGDIICFDAIVQEGSKSTLVKASDVISFYLFYKHTILHQATLINRLLFSKYGFYNEEFRIVSDWEFFIKVLFLYNVSYQPVSFPISVFDSTGVSSQTNNYLISKKERAKVLDKYFSHFLPDYKLLEEKSIYTFLKNLKNFRVLNYLFIVSVKLLNKVIKIIKS